MSKIAAQALPESAADVRQRILETASELFYSQGARAVGVDLVVAKTSLYRYFRTKDDLVAAFLQREDEDFWGVWDGVARAHAGDPAGELEAHLGWIGERVGRPNYRGCPQLNIPPARSPPRTSASCAAACSASPKGSVSHGPPSSPDSSRC